MYTGIVGFFNHRVSPPAVKYEYNKSIEQYRGVCALMVMITHGIVHADMLLNNFSWPEFMDYIGAGYVSVLIFFCISGYVIGINYSHKALDIKAYLKKRAVRLYPVYLVSIILCITVAGGFSVYTLIENIFFFENNVPYVNYQVPILVNYVTWSLNYEVVYYLLFIGLFFLQPKVWKLLLCLLFLSIVTIHCGIRFQFLANYINGFYFWVLGLLIAWNHFDKSGNIDAGFMPFLSILFLHMCQQYLGIGEIVLHTFGVYSITNINWLFDLPFCLMVMAVLTGKDNVFLRANKIVCYAVPGCVFLFLAIHHRLFENIRWEMCEVYWALALLLIFEKRISGFLMEKFTGIGKISYALYLFHVPVGYILKRTVFITNRPAEIVIKYFLWISITMGLSFLAEMKLQPAIKRYFTT
jgi:peptidoglycan/LPS O-acetylase OafA/YrhL